MRILDKIFGRTESIANVASAPEVLNPQYQSLTRVFAYSAATALSSCTPLDVSTTILEKIMANIGEPSKRDRENLVGFSSQTGRVFDSADSLINPDLLYTAEEIALMPDYQSRPYSGPDLNLSRYIRLSRRATPQEISQRKLANIPDHVAAKVHQGLEGITNRYLREIILSMNLDTVEVERLLSNDYETAKSNTQPLVMIDSIKQRIINQSLIINYLVANPTQQVILPVDKEEFLYNVSRYYDLVEDCNPNVLLRYRQCNTHFMEYTRGLEADLVAEKSPQQQPSPHLKFSVQVPAYNEMPSNALDLQRNPRGNLTDFLMSGFIAAESYYSGTENVNPRQDIEFLINVNNKPGEISLGNRRSLTLVYALNNSNNVDEFLSQIDWIVQDTANNVVQFYSVLYERFQSLRAKGMQLHALDLTDGKYIIREDVYGSSVYTFGQGGRRRLLSSVALRRLFQSDVEVHKQLLCFADADCRLSSNYFLQLAESYSMAKSTQVVSFLPRVAREVGGNKLAAEEFSRGLLIAHALRRVFEAFISGLPMKTVISCSPVTVVTNVSGYVMSGGWDYSKDSMEDTDLMYKLAVHADCMKYLDHPIATIIDRERPNSYLGSSSSGDRVRLRGRNLQQYFASNPLQSTFEIRSIISKVNVSAPYLVKEFGLPKGLDGVRLLESLIDPKSSFNFTVEERKLLERFAKDPGRYSPYGTYPELTKNSLKLRARIYPTFNRLIMIGLNLMDLRRTNPRQYPHLVEIFSVIGSQW